MQAFAAALQSIANAVSALKRKPVKPKATTDNILMLLIIVVSFQYMFCTFFILNNFG